MKMKSNEVRVIRDPRNASKDYFLDKIRARELEKEGKLLWDFTNSCYATKNGEKIQ